VFWAFSLLEAEVWRNVQRKKDVLQVLVDAGIQRGGGSIRGAHWVDPILASPIPAAHRVHQWEGAALPEAALKRPGIPWRPLKPASSSKLRAPHSSISKTKHPPPGPYRLAQGARNYQDGGSCSGLMAIPQMTDQPADRPASDLGIGRVSPRRSPTRRTTSPIGPSFRDGACNPSSTPHHPLTMNQFFRPGQATASTGAAFCKGRHCLSPLCPSDDIHMNLDG